MKAIKKDDKPIEEAIEEYADDSSVSHSTLKKRKRIPRDFYENILKDYNVHKINEIHPDHIQKYIEYRRKDGVADLTIRNEITTIQGLLNEFNHIEFLQIFSLKDYGLNTKTNVQQSDKQVKSITKDEYLKLLDHADSLRDELIFRVGWETGVRRSEMSNIDVGDIDLDEQEIRIESAKTEGNTTSYRTVFFDFTTKQKLKKYITINREKYPNRTDTDALFLSHDGMRLSAEHINHKVADTAEDADIQDVIGTNSKGHDIRKVTAHTLRHSFALQRLKNEMPIKMIADIMGDSVDTVAQTYLETKKSDLKEANQKYRPKVYS